jgi:hypothetical protein
MVGRYAHLDDSELGRAVRVTRTHTEAATKTATGEKNTADGSET